MAIEFVGFTADHRITGQIPLADDRLSDMLNSVARVVVRGALSAEIDTGRLQTADATVPCGEFLAVAGTGRRGIESQRRRTMTRLVRLGLGRYVVTGLLHVSPAVHQASLGGKPDALLVGRDLLVPLTEATITYDKSGVPFEETWDTLLVNRARANWIESTESPELAGDAPGGAGERLRRAKYVKDFTGTPSG